MNRNEVQLPYLNDDSLLIWDDSCQFRKTRFAKVLVFDSVCTWSLHWTMHNFHLNGQFDVFNIIRSWSLQPLLIQNVTEFKQNNANKYITLSRVSKVLPGLSRPL